MKQPPPPQPQPHQEHSNNVLSMVCRLLPYAACFLVAFHFAQTTYRVLHDPRGLAFFLLAAYTTLSLLFYCIRRFEALAAADSPDEIRTRERLKLSVWALSTALTAMFACHVSPMMPPPLNQIVWVLSFVLAAYAMPAMLFYCVRTFETLNADSRAEIREKLKLPMWALSTALTAMLSSCPASPLNLLVRWVIAMLLAVGGFCSLVLSDGGEFGNSLEASEIEEKV